jgi:siroheme synthase
LRLRRKLALEQLDGSLTIVGTGIQAVGQLTTEAQSAIETADILHYLVVDPIAEAYISAMNVRSVSLRNLYAAGTERIQTYNSMVDRIMASVRSGADVCAAFYGHPCVFVLPSRLAAHQARLEGYSSRILPGVSAEDCLYADLEIDPSTTGNQSYEATDLLVHKRRIDPTSGLIIWQAGMIGDLSYPAGGAYDGRHVGVLVEYLARQYPVDHMVTIYEASLYPIYKPRRDRVKLADLPSARLTPISTLYIPPAEISDIDESMLLRLGLDASQIVRIDPQRNVLVGVTT